MTGPDSTMGVQALRAQGRTLRGSTPRSTLGSGVDHERDAVAVLDAQNAARLPELVPVRWWRMSQSPFTFYRGAAALMAHDLAATPVTGVRVQACGDAHLSNFGFFASPERQLVFDLNDFDETARAPWEWDVERLIASLAIAARNNGETDEDAEQIARSGARAYREALEWLSHRSTRENFHALVHADRLYQHLEALGRTQLSPKLERATRRARRRTGQHAAARLTRPDPQGELQILENPPTTVRLHQTPEVIARITQDYLASVGADIAEVLGRYRVVDHALRVVGVGSVGTRCYLQLAVDVGGDPLLLQVKEATASVLEPFAGADVHENSGRRVVAGQRIMQGATDRFLGWTSAGGRHFYVRQFRDMKGSLEPEEMSPEALAEYGELCAGVLARAHAQSCEPALLAGYLGSGNAFDTAMARFAMEYAEQNDADHRALLDAIASGRVTAVEG